MVIKNNIEILVIQTKIILFGFLLLINPVLGVFSWGPCPSINIDAGVLRSLSNNYFTYSSGSFNPTLYLGT